MARNKGSANFAGSLEVLAGAPLDARSVVPAKADLTAEGNFPYKYIGMEVYVTAENKKYRLINADPTSLESWEEVGGSSIEVDDEISLTSENPVQNKVITKELIADESMLKVHDSITNYVLKLADRVSQLEKTLTEKDIYLRSCYPTNGIIKENLLPNHIKSKFCRTLTLEYGGTWASSSAETIKINNKEIIFENDITIPAGDHIVKFEVYIVEDFSNAIHIRKTIDNIDTVDAELEDTFVLTIEVATGSDIEMANMNYQLIYIDYKNVSLDYPYPVLELKDGTIVYRDTLAGTNNGVAPAMANSLGGMFDILACYQLGNTAKALSNCFVVHHNNLPEYDSPYEGCEYVYMANWLWLNDCTSLGWCFTTVSFDDGLAVYRSKIKKLDFSKIRFRKLNSMQYGNVWYGVSAPYIAEDIIKVLFEEHEGLYNGGFFFALPECEYIGTNLANFPLDKLQSNQKIGFKQCDNLKSLGDLSGWDMSDHGVSVMFSSAYFLETVGDLSNWDVSNTAGNPANFFKGCFNIRNIGDIGKWDMHNAASIAWILESTNNIGDEDIANLGNWNVSNCANFRGPFSYLYESGFDSETGRVMYYFKSKGLSYPPAIVKPKRDLSFVDKWDVSKGEKFEGFFANNPYLTNVGDLRKWNLAAATITTSGTGYGMTNFLLNCSALENLKMPSIPRGTQVDGFVKGCTSLANIEVDELNVAEISFEDCPLTKASVINLINAATDDVEITLNPTVYAAVSSDADVTAAIATKAASSIIVQLKEATV